jgi:HTH-type transcriptional regulator / antitoxin HigA
MASAAFSPDWASAPGDTIADILRERGVSIAEFAVQIERTPEQVEDLLQGRATITIAIARKLSEVLGGSVEFWMSRDFQYREDVARLQAVHATDREWLRELPLSDMIRFGWLRPAPRPSDEVAACLRFFDMPSVSAWRAAYRNLGEMAAFRTSPSFDSSPASVAAWLRRGEIESEAIECGSWNPAGFEASLVRIRTLTRRKNLDRFLPELRRVCSESGVAVAVVRPPTGCRASGATRFLSKGRALLLLSLRYLSDDQFWFSFFHEAAHLLRHEKRLFLEGVELASTREESEANEFAGNILVPPDSQREMLNLPTRAHDVIRFAVHVGVSPGIIVGQLQHYGRLDRDQLNGLKRRFTW